MIIRPFAFGLVAAIALTGVAHAQPAGPTPPPDGPPPDAVPPDPAPPPAGDTEPPPTGAPATPGPTADAVPVSPYDPQPVAPPLPKKPRRERKIPDLPQILTAPTGRMLPAAYLYSRSSVDTGGGVASELRVGLGDVAEFGIGTTDLIRARRSNDGDPERISPYVMASFRLGVSEDRMFKNQPAFALGFRKSFERDGLGAKSRVAELNFMLSKRIGNVLALHGGVSFWDAALDDGTGEATFHDQATIKEQLRPLGGIEVRPLPDAEILVDVSWAPSFCYAACTGNKFRLDPILSWGVRYIVADWIHLESGVRVPDIRDVNLLDAQIFGQVTFISDRLRKVVDKLGGDD